MRLSLTGKEETMGKKKVANKGPQKKCPKCGAMVHVRKAACDCGHEFKAASKKKAAPKKKATKATPAAPKATSLTAALKAERKTLQQRLAKLDDLLDTYQ
jgi:hypothetical protein